LPDPKSSVFDDYDRAPAQRIRRCADDGVQTLAQMRLMHKPQPQQYDPGTRLIGEADDLAEVEIERDQDAIGFGGAVENLTIWQAAIPGIQYVDCVMSLGSQPFRHCRRHVHVEQEAHPSRFRLE
jgi:hypothetical protein